MPLDPEICDAIRENKTDTLNLSKYSLQDADIEILVDLLIDNTSVRNLYLSHNLIGDEGAIKIAELIEKNRSIRNISAYHNTIGDKGGVAIERALQQGDTLEKIDISWNSAGRETIDAMADVVAHSQNLTTLLLHNQCDADGTQNNLRPVMEKTFAEALKLSRSKNLAALGSMQPGTGSLLVRNEEAARAIGKKLLTDEALTVADLYEIAGREPIIRKFGPTDSNQEMTEALEEFETLLGLLPLLPSSATLTPESLFEQDAQGYTPMDNPRIMDHFPDICQFLKGQGTPLTLEHLETETRDGQSYFSLLMEHARTDTVLAGLNASGIRLQGGFIENGQPSALLEMLIERRCVSDLFTEENWKGGSTKELQSVFRAIPDDQKPKNHHALLTRLRQAESAGIKR